MAHSRPAFAETAAWYLQLRATEVDERLIRQVIELELREIEIPRDPTRDFEEGEAVSLHIEVVQSEERLSVSLFDRGELAGVRKVSALGQDRIVARRVGLAVAELARQLRDHRVRAERYLTREQELAAKRALVSAFREQQRAVRWGAGVSTQVLTQGAFLLGPRVSLEINDYFPLRLVVALTYQAGWIARSETRGQNGGHPPWSRWQLEWGAEWIAQPNFDNQLSAGLHAGASVVSVGQGVNLDQIEGQNSSWSAQLGLRVAWAMQSSLGLMPRVHLDVGRILRPLPLSQAGQDSLLGGYYFGVGATALISRE